MLVDQTDHTHADPLALIQKALESGGGGRAHTLADVLLGQARAAQLERVFEKCSIYLMLAVMISAVVNIIVASVPSLAVECFVVVCRFHETCV